MRDDRRQDRIKTYIDGWMEKLNARAQKYISEGATLDEALEKATLETRMEIRRSPPVDLEIK